MSDEKVTPELVNEIACNAITFQKSPLKTRVDVKEIDPTLTKTYENAWKYENPKIFVLYESGKIVYDDKLYYMNEQARNALIKTLKAQEKAAKRKELGQMIRYTLAATATIIGAVVLINVISKAVQSEQKEQSKTEKVQSVKDSVLNPADTVVVSNKQLQR